MSLYESRRIPKENKRLQLLWVVLHHVAMFISYYVNDITVKIVSAKCELTWTMIGLAQNILSPLRTNMVCIEVV